MAAIHSSGNVTTELNLVRFFRKEGISHWRRHQKIFNVRPDFIFPKQRVVIFVHGCFWHGCKLHRSIPKTNVKFWREKINGNKKRDIAVLRKIKHFGWKPLIVWEHGIKKYPEDVIKKIKKALN